VAMGWSVSCRNEYVKAKAEFCEMKMARERLCER